MKYKMWFPYLVQCIKPYLRPTFGMVSFVAKRCLEISFNISISDRIILLIVPKYIAFHFIEVFAIKTSFIQDN